MLLGEAKEGVFVHARAYSTLNTLHTSFSPPTSRLFLSINFVFLSFWLLRSGFLGGMFGSGKDKEIAMGETKDISALKTQSEVTLKIRLTQGGGSRRESVRQHHPMSSWRRGWEGTSCYCVHRTCLSYLN